MRPAGIVLLCILASSVLSAVLAFDRFYIGKDYWVFANVACDPSIHSCFIGDGDATPNFYSEIQEKAYAVLSCDGWAGECEPLTCTGRSETVCQETFCSSENGDACYSGSHN